MPHLKDTGLLFNIWSMSIIFGTEYSQRIKRFAIPRIIDEVNIYWSYL